jgi:hypothetical protein
VNSGSIPGLIFITIQELKSKGNRRTVLWGRGGIVEFMVIFSLPPVTTKKPSGFSVVQLPILPTDPTKELEMSRQS